MSSKLLDYASPRPEPFDEDEDNLRVEKNIRRLTVLAGISFGSLAAITCFCLVGVRWAQRREGVGALQEAVTGTDAYERWLMDYPTAASIAVCAVVIVWVLAKVLRLRWSPLFLVVVFALPLLWFAWFGFMAMTVWEDGFP